MAAVAISPKSHSAHVRGVNRETATPIANSGSAPVKTTPLLIPSEEKHTSDD